MASSRLDSAVAVGMEEEKDESEATPTPQPKVVPCGVCTAGTAKYKCPRCFVQTCSLPCVMKHKEDAKCRWVRMRVRG
jgi:hypothetical protein